MIIIECDCYLGFQQTNKQTDKLTNNKKAN